jgi:transcriptional regulator with XRE-family HTH domain
MAPTTYADVLARNIRAARNRIDIGQDSMAARMRALGYTAWIRQTASSTERGRRRPTAEEIFGLACALETTIANLMAPKDEDTVVEFPSGQPISVVFARMSAAGKIIHGAIRWDGDNPLISELDYPPGALDLFNRLATGQWPPEE